MMTVELAPDYLPDLIRQGDGFLKNNFFKEAVIAYNSALKIDADNPHALVGLASVDIVKGDLAHAQQKLESATVKTDFRIGADILISVYEDQGFDNQALALRRILKTSDSFSYLHDPWMFELQSESFDTDQITVLARMADRGGDTVSGIRLLNRAIQLAPKDGSLHFQLGLIHVKCGDSEQAHKSFSECTSVDPTISDGWFQLAKLYEIEGNQPELDRALVAGLFHNPNSPVLHLASAERLKKLGELNGAINELETTIRIRPEDAEPYVQLAICCIAQSENEKGVVLLKQALELESLHPLALATRAFFCILEGFESDAREYIAEAHMQPLLFENELLNLEEKFKTKFGKEP
jgi:Flp pilus assembly protein TadD